MNNGSCFGCRKLFDKYPNFHPALREWFDALQSYFPDAHISCAGRGKDDQLLAFENGASKANWLESAHNFNAAIDIFRNEIGKPIYYTPWYQQIILPFLLNHNNSSNEQITWYGMRGSKFFELPHFEIKNWESLGLNPVE